MAEGGVVLTFSEAEVERFAAELAESIDVNREWQQKLNFGSSGEFEVCEPD